MAFQQLSNYFCISESTIDIGNANNENTTRRGSHHRVKTKSHKSEVTNKTTNEYTSRVKQDPKHSKCNSRDTKRPILKELNPNYGESQIRNQISSRNSDSVRMSLKDENKNPTFVIKSKATALLEAGKLKSKRAKRSQE